MDWQYSNPLSGALLTATNNNSSNIGLGSTSLLSSSLYSSYDPLISRYKARANLYNSRLPGSIGLFDDIDDLALEVEASELLSSRYRPPLKSQYIPSYYSNNNLLSDNKTSLNNNFDGDLYDKNTESNNNIQPKNINKSNQIPQLPPGGTKQNKGKPNNNNLNKNLKLNQQPNRQTFAQPKPQQFQNQNATPNYEYQQVFQPIPFNQQQYQPPQNIQIQAHNSQQQRFLQYQNRIQQQQQQQQFNNNNNNDNNLSELEILKMKQQQERQQLLAAIGSNNSKANNHNNYNNNSNNNQFFQQPHNLHYKQYSEASIPSTNADPLNSNSPTPPMLSHRFDKINKNFNQKNGLKKDDPQDPGKCL